MATLTNHGALFSFVYVHIALDLWENDKFRLSKETKQTETKQA